jgi:hypothetical protein
MEPRSCGAEKYIKHLKYAKFIIDTKRRLLHRPKRKMRQKIIIFSDVKAPKRLVST